MSQSSTSTPDSESNWSWKRIRTILLYVVCILCIIAAAVVLVLYLTGYLYINTDLKSCTSSKDCTDIFGGNTCISNFCLQESVISNTEFTLSTGFTNVIANSDYTKLQLGFGTISDRGFRYGENKLYLRDFWLTRYYVGLDSENNAILTPLSSEAVNVYVTFTGYVYTLDIKLNLHKDLVFKPKSSKDYKFSLLIQK